MTYVPNGALSPIEDVIAEAERKAEAEWHREHTPCPHDNWVDVTAVDSWSLQYLCADCGDTKREPR